MKLPALRNTQKKKKEKEKKNKCTWDCCYSDNQQCKQKSGRCHERKNEFPGVQKT